MSSASTPKKSGITPAAGVRWHFGRSLVILALPFLLGPLAHIVRESRARQGAWQSSGARIVSLEYFGLHIHRALSTTPWPQVPFGSWRLWDAGVAWPSLEPSPGHWQFDLLDRYVSLASNHNVSLLLPLALSPPWVSRPPAEPSGYAPGFASPPRDLAAWRQYVLRVASRYKGRVHAYEIWNEPNLKQFFTGSVSDMVNLAREAYSALKEIDSTVVVVSPAAVGGQGIKWLDEYLTAGGGRYADVIGFHFYNISGTPEDMASEIAAVRGVMDYHGLGSRPLWNTETGWLIASDSGPVDPRLGGFPMGTKVLSQSDAAAYVARALILGWSGGLSRFYWYSWDHKAMGLAEVNGALKPAAVAYRQVEKWLIGGSLSCDRPRPDDTWLCTISGQGGSVRTIAWNPRREVQIPIAPVGRGAEIDNLDGSVTRVGVDALVRVSSIPILVRPSP